MIKYKQNIIALGIFTLVTLIFTWPLLPNITTHYPSTYYGHGGDPNMYIWFMDIMAKKVANWDFHPGQMIYYPDGLNFWAGYEAPIILSISTPIILVTHNPIFAYNIILLLGFILTSYVCYIFIRYLTNSYYSALITGFSFGFSEYMMVRGTQHLDLLFLFTLPLVALWAFKFIENPDRRNTIYLVLSILLTALSAWYYLFGALIFLGILFLFNLRKFWEKKKQYLVAGFLVGLTISIAAFPMILNRSDKSYHYVDILVEHRGADTLNFFIPHPYIYSWTNFTYSSFASLYESTSYYGLVGIAAIIVMLFLYKKIEIPYRGFWMLITLVFMLIALGKYIEFNGYQIPMLFSFLDNFPPFDRLRAPNRFFVFSYFATTVLFGYFLVYIKNKIQNIKSRFILITILIVSLLISERFILSYPIMSIPVPEFYQSIGKSDEKYAIVDVPFIDPGLSIYNYYQVYHKKAIVDGEYFWTAYNDHTYDFIDNNPLLYTTVTCEEEALAKNLDTITILKGLSENNIRYVVVHNFIIPDIDCYGMADFIHRFFENQKPVYADGEITVYDTGVDKPRQ